MARLSSQLDGKTVDLVGPRGDGSKFCPSAAHCGVGGWTRADGCRRHLWLGRWGSSLAGRHHRDRVGVGVVVPVGHWDPAPPRIGIVGLWVTGKPGNCSDPSGHCYLLGWSSSANVVELGVARRCGLAASRGPRSTPDRGHTTFDVGDYLLGTCHSERLASPWSLQPEPHGGAGPSSSGGGVSRWARPLGL